MGRYGMSVGRYGVAMGCVWGTVGRCVPAPQLSLPTGSGLQLPGAAPTALQLNGALPLGALNPAALTGVGQGAMGRCGVAMGRYGAHGPQPALSAPQLSRRRHGSSACGTAGEGDVWGWDLWGCDLWG